MKQPVFIGGAYVNGDLIVSIVDAVCPQAKKLVKAAKERDNLLDFTCGESRGAVILLNDNRIILSHMTPHEIVGGMKEKEN